MEDSIVERILILVESYGLTSSAFADKIDVQRSSVSHLISGRNKPSLDFIQKVLNHFPEINSKWLIMGTGPMKQLDLFDDAGKPAKPEPVVYQKNVSDTPPAPPAPLTMPDIQPEEKVVLQNRVAMPESISVAAEPVKHTNPEPAVVSTPAAMVAPKEENKPLIAAPSVAGENKKVSRIVFFYDDNTFETFNPK